MNIVEFLRKNSVKKLFSMDSFSNSFKTWNPEIIKAIGTLNGSNIINLGDELRNIFFTTRASGRSQGDLAGGGHAWEGLVCWYLNLCLIGSRAVAFRQNKKFMPIPIKDALTVNYGNFKSGTESDIIVIVFPDKPNYSSDISALLIKDASGNKIDNFNQANTFNYNKIVDRLTTIDFNDIEVGVIQCKTNWNDNAQIPMLWDSIYSANSFSNNISVGYNSFSHKHLKSFSYSFITVPTQKSEYKANTTCVHRLANLSGGNYWGNPTEANIARNIKEIFTANFTSASTQPFSTTIDGEIHLLPTFYSYFGI